MKDPLTAAYLAIGANSALQKDGDITAAGPINDLLTNNDGHVGVIAKVLALSDELSELSRQYPDAFDVWAYDVAEPAGKAAVKMLTEGKPLNAYQLLRRALLPQEEGIYLVLSGDEPRLAYYNEGRFEWDGEPVPNITRWTRAMDEEIAQGSPWALAKQLLSCGPVVLPETRPLGRCSCTDPECLHPSDPGGEGDCNADATKLLRHAFATDGEDPDPFCDNCADNATRGGWSSEVSR